MSDIEKKIDAMLSLRPNAKWELDENENFVWDSSNTDSQPTDAEIDAEVNNIAWKTNRRLAYPAIEEQLDMLYHAIDAGTVDKTSSFYTTLKAVKDANPKS